MRTLEIPVFTFDELSDSAKERARTWWRDRENQDCNFDATLEDVERVAAILGISFDVEQIRLYGGGTRPKSKIYWSGSCSQGDGASFEGYYRYAKGSAREIRRYAPNDNVLAQIADDLVSVQAKHFYGLTARVYQSGRYVHANTVRVEAANRDGNMPSDNVEDLILEALRDFANWIYKQLESEYEFIMSDENVDECIRINEYEFTEEGKLV